MEAKREKYMHASIYMQIYALLRSKMQQLHSTMFHHQGMHSTYTNSSLVLYTPLPSPPKNALYSAGMLHTI
jgi:hypothetical protein